MTPEQELKERVKALIAADAKGAAPQQAPIYEQTPATDIYEKQYTKATGKAPFRTLDQQAQGKEVVKARVKAMITDDLLKDVPTEMRDKLGYGDSLRTERGTLEEEQRLRNPEYWMKQRSSPIAGVWGGKGIATPLLEKERRGEKLSTLERAGAAAYHGATGLMDTASGGFTKEQRLGKVPGQFKARMLDLYMKSAPGGTGFPSMEGALREGKTADYEPQYIEGKLANVAGSLFGLGVKGGVPGEVHRAVKMISDTKLLPQIMANPKLNNLAKQIVARVVKGAELGPTLAASDAFGPLNETEQNFLHGALLGEVFAAGGAITPKNKALGFLMRNVANRIMATGVGQYDPKTMLDIAKGIKTGDWGIATQKLFDEALLSWFSAKGTTGKQIEEIVPRMKAAEKAYAEGEAKQKAMSVALHDKYKGEMAEAQGMADIKVNPDIVKLGELLANYDNAKAISGVPPGRLQKMKVEIVDLYKKIRGGMREGEVMPEEAVALGKYQQRVPGMAEQPRPAAAPEPTPAPQATTEGQPANPYTTTTTAKTQAEVEKTPVVPPAMLPDLHTPEHYVHDGTTFQKTEGKDIEISPDVDTFVHRGGSGSRRTWVIIEGKSGIPIGIDTTQEGAVKMAKAAIEQPNFPDLIKDAMSKTGASPRYVQAQGAGMMGLQTRKIAESLPSEIEELERRLLAGKTSGAGTASDPHLVGGDYMPWAIESKLMDLASQKTPPAGVISTVENAQRGERGVVIERPYGRLVRYGSRWSMQLNPGVDPESLKKAPGGKIATTRTYDKDTMPWDMTLKEWMEAPDEWMRGQDDFARGMGEEAKRDVYYEQLTDALNGGNPLPAKVFMANEQWIRDFMNDPEKWQILNKFTGERMESGTGKIRPTVHVIDPKTGQDRPLYTIPEIKKFVKENAHGGGAETAPKGPEPQLELAPPKPKATRSPRRQQIEKTLADEAAKDEAALDPELFKAERGYPMEMANPKDVAEFRAAKKGGLKGLTIEEVEYVTNENKPQEKDYRPPWWKFMAPKRDLPAQREIPRTGTYTAVMTDDGGIYSATEPFRSQPWHYDLIQKLGIPPDRVVSGGYVRDGVYEAERFSEAEKYARTEKIRLADEAKRKYQEQMDKGGIKGLSVEQVHYVMADAAEQGKEVRGGFYGYLREKAKAEAPPPIPDKGESPTEVGKPTEKTWFVGMKVVNNLKRMGSGGTKAAQGIMEYARKRMQWTQKDLYGAANVAQIIQGNTEAGQADKPSWYNVPARRADNAARAEQTGKRMRELIERKIKPADEIEARAVDIIRTRLDEIAKEAEKLGVKVSGVYGEKKWRAVKDYYPHEWLGLEELWEGDIHRNMKDVIVEKIAKEHFGELYRDPATKAKAMETAEKYWDDFRNDLKTARYGHLEMQRILDDEFVETLRKRWEAKFPDKPFPLKLNENISVLFRYLAGANNRIAWLQEFGKDEAHKGWMVPEKVLGWSREMENPENRAWMYKRFSDILRRGGQGKWQNLSNYVQSYQLLKMTFASLPNMWQWATNTVPNITSKAAVEALWDTAKFFGAGGAEAKKQAREFFSGTGAGRLSADMQAAMSSRPEMYSAYADALLKLYGFTGTEFYNRLYSSFAGKRYAEHLADKLHKSGELGWRSPQYIAELKKMGLDAPDVERLMRDGPLTKENVEKLAEAGYNMTRITQFMTDNFFLPSTWANPGVRILTQFKNFAYNQTSLLYNEPVKQAARFIKTGAQRLAGKGGEVTGDLAPLLKTAAILPIAGSIVYHLKKELYKDLGITFYEKMLAGKSEPLKWFSYIFNAGGFGIGSDIVTSVAMGKAGLTNLIGGPTVSDIAELGDAVMKTWGDLSKGSKWASHRAETIQGYWTRFGGRISPTAKIILNQFFGEYKKVTDFNQWSRLVRDFYRKYKETYMLESPAVAEEIWQAFMNTQGRDYEEAMAKMGQRRKLEKPTKREIRAWWDEMGSAPSERVPMPGKKKGATLGEFYY